MCCQCLQLKMKLRRFVACIVLFVVSTKENINVQDVETITSPATILQQPLQSANENLEKTPRTRGNFLNCSADKLQKHLIAQETTLKEMSQNIKENNSSLKRCYRALEKLADAKKKNKLEEEKRHHKEVEKVLREKAVTKQRLLEIEELKLRIRGYEDTDNLQ